MPIIRLLRHAIVAIIAAIALYFGVHLAQFQMHKQGSVNTTSSERAHVEKTLLTLPLLTMDNQYSTLADQMAAINPRYTLVNLWATWCGPCREELPLFESVYQRYRSSDILVIGVADDDFDKVRGFADSLGLTFPQLINDGSILNLTDYFGTISAIPLTVLLDSDGNLINHKFGAFHGDELERFIEQYATNLSLRL